MTLAPVLTFRFRMFAKTVLDVWMFAVTRLDDTRFAWPAVKYVTFAPVLTFRLRMFEKTALSVCTLAVTRFEETKLAWPAVK